MSSYLDKQSTRRTPQSEPIPGSTQVPNSAGGYTWPVDDWTRLHRFLIMGSEGGSYYAREQELTTDNVDAVRRCIVSDGSRVVQEVLAVSTNGRAPKQDPGIFVLALCASAGLGTGQGPDERADETRRAALAAVPHVCRYGSTLFMFVRFVEQHRGWGRGLRDAIGSWYTESHFSAARRADGEEVTGHVDALAYQAVKYRSRYGYTHRDLLRLAHPKTDDQALANLLAWMAGKGDTVPKNELSKNPSMPKGWRRSRFPSSVIAYEAAQVAESPADIVKLLGTFGDKLPREAIPDELQNADVWDAMLHAGQGVPMTALIRNLGTMTRKGLLTPTSEATRFVVGQLGDVERLRRARVHPIAVLAALKTYESGGVGGRGRGEPYVPVPSIVDALDAAFYASFGNVPATGKRYLLGLDVSASMTAGAVAGIPGLTPRIASAAMAMVTAATGDPYEVVAFTAGSSSGDWRYNTALMPLPLSPRQRLTDILRQTDGLPFGGTDCSLPMRYASQERREVDVFAVYTDSETWHGSIHPTQALREYRQQSGIPAKLIVVGMVSNGFTIADPNDAGMLDVVGFDTATPAIMEAFATG